MQTNWWPGLIALFGGLIAAGIVLSLLGKRGNVPVADDEAKQLDAKVQALKEQLKELSADKHLYDEAAFAQQKARLEQEAVAAMRARDERKGKKAEPKRVRKEPAPSKYPTLVGALYGAGVTGFIAAAFFVLQMEQPKTLASVASTNDPRYEAMLVLSAISLSLGDQEKLLQSWEIYMRQNVPRRRPPQLQRAIEWLEKVSNDEDPRQ